MPSPRRRHATLSALLAALLLLSAVPVARAQLTKIETGDLRLIYFKGTESYLVPHATRTFLNAMRFHKRLFDYQPSEKVSVLLADLSDHGNAGATSIPRDAVRIQIAPLSYIFETVTANERMNMIMNHELTHVATMDRPAASDRFFRTVFAGKVMPVDEQPETILYFYLTSPRLATPRWYLEGIAVFLDTWMGGGIGRAQGAWDEMVFRSMVRDGSRFYDPLGLVSEGVKVDFQTETNSYLYGTRFMTWLAYEYSPEKLIQWVSRREGSRAYYASNFERVFGTSLEKAWARWVEWEHGFQEENLARIREFPRTPYKDISHRALGSVSRPAVDPAVGKLYAAFYYPGIVAHVGSIDLEDGSVEKIKDVKGPVKHSVTSLAYDPETRTIFYTTDNDAYRDLVALDPATGKTRMLLKDGRIGDLAWSASDRSLWGIRTFDGICTLVQIPSPWTAWKKVYSWPYGQVAYDLDVSPDGSLISVSVGEVTGHQSVKIIPVEGLSKGDPTPRAEFDFGTAVPSSFVFSPDGRYLYGTSYYTGVSNVFRYEIATHDLQAVTNSETGFFRPVPLGGDDLICFRYTGEGFVPTRIRATPVEDVNPIVFLGARLAEKHPVVKSWKLPPPSSVSYDEKSAKPKPYHITRGMGLESLYPVAQGYKDSPAVGLRVNFSDPLLLNQADIVASYSPDGALPDDEKVHLAAEFHRYDWRAFAWLNSADFYDLFGPTKVGRRGHAVGLGWNRTLLYDRPRSLQLDLEANYFGNLDTLPEYQNVPVTVDRLVTARAELTYRDLRSSLGHVDDEKGVGWSVVLQGQYVDGRAVPRLHGTLDLGFGLPLRHSSVWLRSAAGFSPRDRDDPFANFYFGGFGNNWVDRGNEKRYREYYALPGVELNEIGGRNFAKSTLEWNLPPVRFREVGKPGFYLTWARPALFSSVLATDLDSAAFRRVLWDAGGQVDFRITALSSLDVTVSAGYALAFEDGHRPRHEGMVSLKILR